MRYSQIIVHSIIASLLFRSNGAVVFTGHDGSVSGCDFSSDGLFVYIFDL